MHTSSFFDETTGIDFTNKASSVPISIGVNYLGEVSSDVQFGIGGYLGLGPNTQYSAIASNKDTPNETNYSGNAFHILLRTSLILKISEMSQLFAEGGYRYLNTGSLSVSKTGNGSSVFASNGDTAPVAVNLSGPFLGGGLSLSF